MLSGEVQHRLWGAALLGALSSGCAGDDSGPSGTNGSTSAAVPTAQSTDTAPATPTGGDGMADDTTSAAESSTTTGGPRTTGADGSTGTTAGDSDSGSGSSGAASCDRGFTCAETATDWTGPLAIDEGMVGGVPIACGGAFGELVYEGSFNLPPADHECVCDCDVDETVSCGPVSLQVHNNNVCFGIPSIDVELDEGCDDIPNIAAAGTFVWAEVDILGEGCDPDTSGTFFDEPAFEDAMIACSPGERTNAGCEDDELCLPIPVPPFETTLCLLREGDHECPGGTDYTERTLYYDGIEDSRDCNACTCSLSGAGCDLNQMFFFGTSNCSGSPNGSLSTAEDCNDPAATVVSSVQSSGAVADAGSCAPGANTGDEIGGIMPSAPTTVCCLPE